MIALLAAVVAALNVMVIALLMLGWGRRLNCAQRVGLCLLAAGIIWAAPSRFQQPIGLGDLMFVSGILATLLATHGRKMLARADALDGRVDGRISWPPRRASRQANGDLDRDQDRRSDQA